VSVYRRSLPALAILLIAGCSLTGGAKFRVVLERPDLDPLPITLTDMTGTVVGLERLDPVGAPWDEGAAPLADAPNAIAITWMGGACDHSVTLQLEARAGSPLLIGTTHRANACRMIGIPRSIAIWFGAPVDRANFSVAIDQDPGG
jgi:hypothetical protein